MQADTAGRLRGLYDFRVRASASASTKAPTARTRRGRSSYQRLRRELLDAERAAVLSLRREGVVSDDVMNRVLRDIALEDVRLDFER